MFSIGHRPSYNKNEVIIADSDAENIDDTDDEDGDK
jgi:hypothetical protein